MEKPRIAIIGANEAIDTLIKKAKEKGYETHVFAWECGDPGEKSADVFYPISVADKEKILEECRTLNIKGVVSITSDFTVNTVNYVARNLGLVSNSKKTDEVARNKYKMRNALKAAGIYTPWFVKVNKLTDLSFLEHHEYPVIVKPTDRWSSKGVTRVNKYADLRSAVEYAISQSLQGEVIVESFMEGQEYSAECLCWKGEYRILAFTQKMTTGYPHYIETGHIEPSNISSDKQKQVTDIIFKALFALDIKYGAAHAEFRTLDNGEIGIIEIGARMGGDCIGTDLVYLSTGYDYVGLIIDIACGIRPNIKKYSHYKSAKVTFILNNDDYNLYLTDKKRGNVLREFGITDDVGGSVIDSSTRHGYYISVQG